LDINPRCPELFYSYGSIKRASPFSPGRKAGDLLEWITSAAQCVLCTLAPSLSIFALQPTVTDTSETRTININNSFITILLCGERHVHQTFSP
jgi:hypothetical protein